MPWKYICILANSNKQGERCIAGIEMLKDDEGKLRGTDTWIRPVSARRDSGGALDVEERRYTDASEPEMLDVARIPLLECENDWAQPENWRLDTSVHWERIGKVRPQRLRKALDRPESLWLDPEEKKSDRIRPEVLKSGPWGRSLYLIEPERFRIEVYPESNPWKNTMVIKREAVFVFLGHSYRLHITDPAAEEKYCASVPLDAPKRVIELDPGNRCFLCISLTPEFNGKHYKVVAGLLEFSE